MSNSTTDARTLPGSNFDQSQTHLDWVPPEITSMVHKLILPSDEFVITSKDARKGLLGPVSSTAALEKGVQESTFSFSTIYASAISNKTSFNSAYRLLAQQYIIDELNCITINVQDFQFANTRKLFRTLQNRGKLQDFLSPADEADGSDENTPARQIRFHHIITKKFTGNSSIIEKFSKWIETMKKPDELFNMKHDYIKFADSSAFRQCISDLSAVVTTTRPRQRDIIADQLRECADILDQQKLAENHLMDMISAQAQQDLEDLRERVMRDELEEDVVGPDIGDADEVEIKEDADVEEKVKIEDEDEGEGVAMQPTGSASWGGLRTV
ncbi:uncharacterized protein RCC_09592 [Ramularia collo-cygni]|uniref:Uncharacterized protein n=1 Tax=Ramularia collo-cygni TaxID=112498 RepID=A0A2D3V0M8_9PEZI|nr:uncharacterized protein RCC_09592 [Ramularia collo-cygni]CZT23877.1 uncharacterized protein RCC_09592 [Ramularia collo-cygni]